MFRTKWEIFTEFLFDKLVPLEDVEIDNPMIKLGNNLLGYGLYQVCVTIEMTIDTRFKTTRCGYVKIIASHLVANLVGGSDTVASIETNVSLMV